MDETVVAWEVIEEKPALLFIMTTWHDNEGLDEALWFVQHLAFNPESQQGTEPCIVALVGRPDLVEHVSTHLERSSL